MANAVMNNQLEKYSSDNCRAPGLTRQQKVAWLRNNLPVIVQPVCDIKEGYPLIGIFVVFEDASAMETAKGNYRVHLKIIYEGEATYDRRPRNKTKPNYIGSFFYRSFNFLSFRRTVDIDQMCFEGVQFGDDVKESYSSIWTEDYNGEQVWNHGVKGDFCFCFSLNYHYDLDAPFGDWQKFENTNRPIVNLNTNNHLMGPEDRNPDLEKHYWVNYPVWEGNTADAELYGRAIAVHKPTLISCFRWSWCCCLTKLQPDPIDPNYFVELPVFTGAAEDVDVPAPPTSNNPNHNDEEAATLVDIKLDLNGVPERKDQNKV